VANLLNEETAQLYALCGRGARASLRVLRHGLAVAEMAVSELPGNPTAVWTIRRAAADELDAYIVVSFTNATLVRAPSRPTFRGRDDASIAVSFTKATLVRAPDARSGRGHGRALRLGHVRRAPWALGRAPTERPLRLPPSRGSGLCLVTGGAPTFGSVTRALSFYLQGARSHAWSRGGRAAWAFWPVGQAARRCCPLARRWRR